MLFLDTSALVKRYVAEQGTELVLGLMERDGDWAASAVAQPEAESTLCRGRLDRLDEATRRQRLRADLERFLVVAVDAPCLPAAVEIGCEHGLRTLDAIHLAAASRLPRPLVFLTFDRRQAAAAEALGFELGRAGG